MPLFNDIFHILTPIIFQLTNIFVILKAWQISLIFASFKYNFTHFVKDPQKFTACEKFKLILYQVYIALILHAARCL